MHRACSGSAHAGVFFRRTIENKLDGLSPVVVEAAEPTGPAGPTPERYDESYSATMVPQMGLYSRRRDISRSVKRRTEPRIRVPKAPAPHLIVLAKRA